MTKIIDIPTELVDMTLAHHALNSANDGITIADMQLPDEPLIFINKAFEDMTGYNKSEVLGKNCRFLQGDASDQKELSIIRLAIENHEGCRVILKNYTKDGDLFWNELSLAPILDTNGKLTHYVGVQKDITTDIVQKDRIIYLSEHDELTGLYNYRGFFSQFDNLVSKAINKSLMIGIGIADIDYFKEINDRHGHLKGNNILNMVGGALLHEFADNAIVARFGGDEFCFAMLLNDEKSTPIYDKITNVMQATNSALADSLQITMSVGVCVEKASKETRIDRLIHLADKVMYDNKQIAHLNQMKKNK